MCHLLGIFSYPIGYNWLLITVWPSLNRVNSLAIAGVMYCTMVFICDLPDLSPVKVLLFWLGSNSTDVAIFNFLPCPSV